MDAKVTFWPSGRAVKVRRGTTLLDAARQAGVNIATRCGGKASCFMCKVNVRPGSELYPIGDNERRKLGGLEANGTRLACQTRATGAVEVDIPLDPLKAVIAKQLAKQSQQDDKLW